MNGKMILMCVVGVCEIVKAQDAGVSGKVVDIPFTRTISYAMKPTPRKRAVDRTWIFAERQLYGVHQNTLHVWRDRPLFLDARVRDDVRGGEGAAYFRDIEIARAAGFDGFGWLEHEGVYERHLNRLRHAGDVVCEGYSHMIIIPARGEERDVPRVKRMLMKAAENPYTFRLKGKLVLWCYGDAEIQNEKLETRNEKKNLAGGERQKPSGEGALTRAVWWARRLKQEVDVPPFLIFGDVPFMDLHRGLKDISAFRQKVREALKDLDGLQIICTDYSRTHDGGYEAAWRTPTWYREQLVPVLLEEMNQPENRGKLLGAYIRQGYVNQFTGVVDGQFGTATLREYLDALMLLRPDILMCFEWNELWENTHFQPTIYNGHACARILNYYRAQLDGSVKSSIGNLAVDSTDAKFIPNLIVSVRQDLKVGEEYPVELLYLPDAALTNAVHAQVRVYDERGSVVRIFPEETFATNLLTAVTYRMSSEHFWNRDALRLELTTRVGEDVRVWRGFDTTRLAATTCDNYLYSRHPIREMAAVEGGEPILTQTPTRYHVEAHVKTTEPIASFELLNGDQEWAAAHETPTAPQAISQEALSFRGVISALDTLDVKPHEGIFTCEGMQGATLRSGNYAWEGFHIAAALTSQAWRVSCKMVPYTRATFFLMLPTQDLTRATITLQFPECFTQKVRLAEIAAKGRYAWQLPGHRRLELMRADDVLDIPAPLDTREAFVACDFSNEALAQAARFPILSTRVITRSGKIWRSPVVLPWKHAAEKKPLSIWSDTLHKPITREIAADRIPDFTYAFTNTYGCFMQGISAHTPSVNWAKLGGASYYAEPYLGAFHRKRVPPDFVQSFPTWVYAETPWQSAAPSLHFDGKGMALTFPVETLPHGSEYTLDFTIKPDATNDYVLLRQQRADGRSVGLQLAVIGGTLRISHFGRLIVPRHFDTKLKIPVNEWSQIHLTKRFTSLTCRVETPSLGTKHFSTPYDRRALMFQETIFGGNIEPGAGLPPSIRPYSGLLQSFHIRHQGL